MLRLEYYDVFVGKTSDEKVIIILIINYFF
jgi:hypothetical protein